MTKHIPDMQMGADPASRRAHVQKWIARNQRRLAAGLGSAVLMLPMLAQAQAADMVSALDISGVRSATVNPDGSANLTLTNGQVVKVAASSVQVAADGTIMISGAAAELVAEVVASVAAAGAAGGTAAAIGAAVAGAAGLAAAASGGGSSSGSPAPIYINAGALSGESPIIATDLFRTFPALDELEEGDRVYLRLSEGDPEAEIQVTIGAGGEIIFPPGVDASGFQGPQTISFRVERDRIVEGEDDEGNPTFETVTDEVASGSADVVVDTIPPEVAITTPVAGDDILNAAEQGEPLEISGTTDAEDGQIVTLTFNGNDYTATVADGAWSVTIPAGDLAGLADGDDLTITADVSDVAGNPATQATATLATDFTAEVTISQVTVETLNTFTGVDVTGSTTGVEEGQAVTVTFDGTAYPGTVGADGSWTVTVPASVIDALDDGAEIAISVSVSDVAGNPASATASATTDFSTPALVITAPEDGGFINAADAAADITVSGIALAGSEVTVTLGTATQTVTAGEDNSWSVTFASTDLPGEDGPLTITAATEIAGTPVTAPEVTLTLDTTPPALTVESTVTEAGLVLSGTTDPDVESVAVDVGGESFTATAEGGSWSLTIATGDLPPTAQGGTVTITADASDRAGNPATQQTLALTAPTLTIIEPVDGFTIGLDEFEGGTNISGSSTDVAEGADVTITIQAGDDVIFTGTAAVGNDGGWALSLDAATVQGFPDQATLSVTASATGASYPLTASGAIELGTDIPPQITIDPLGEEGALILGEDLTISGSTRGVQEGQIVTITDGDGTPLGTAEVGADGTWSAPLLLGGVAPGDSVSISAEVSNASDRSVTETASAVGYEAADYLVLGATTVTSGAAAGALEFAFFLDPRTQLPADFGLAFGETMTFDINTATWAPSPAPQFTTGLSPILNLNDAATGTVIFGGIGFLNPEDPETGDPVDLYQLPLIRFRLNHVDEGSPIQLDFDSQVGGSYSFALGTEAADALVAGDTDAAIRGRGGNDAIDLSAPGVNTVIFEADGTSNGEDVVTGFTTGGALPDRIGIALDDQGALRGDGTAFEVIAAGDSIGENTGLVVFTTAIADDAAGLLALQSLGLQADDIIYLIVGDEVESELLRIVVDGDGNLPDLDTGVEVLALFEGMGSEARAELGAENFLDFVPASVPAPALPDA